MSALGRGILILGVLLCIVGLVLMFADKANLPLGRLPGDFSHRGKNFSFYFPLGTSLLLSVILTLLIYLISRFRR